MVLQELNRPPQPKQRATTDPLSERELEVLRQIAHGMSNQEIADALVVGEATVSFGADGLCEAQVRADGLSKASGDRELFDVGTA